MVQITTKGPNDGKWPFVEIAKSSELKEGQWLVSLGHPNGYKDGRMPVARLGRLDGIGKGDPNSIQGKCLRTSCTLVGGDSGGPLFNLEGKLIGIHSQIGPSIKQNMHVPVDEFRKDWDMLAKGDKVTREAAVKKLTVTLGVSYANDDDEKPPVLDTVIEDGPAEAAKLKVGDVITSFDGNKIDSLKALRELLLKYKPDTEVEVVVKRGSKIVTVTMVLGKR